MKMIAAIVLSAIMMSALAAGVAAAQVDDGCADPAGNGYRLCGTFRDYWEGNDGATLFGSPLSDEFSETQFASGASYDVQYFERQRFELHPENAGTPYAVMLGRLGAEVLGEYGRDWTRAPKDAPSAANYQAATGFAIAPEFIDHWSGHGLDFGDGGVSFRESLGLFGYPISTAQTETGASGDVLTQWFERARFELQAGQVVVAGLGAETLDVPGVADPAVASTLAQVQRAVASNGDLDVALEAGWGLVDGLDHCFNNPGVGAMGFHYINTGLLDTALDPLQPEAMVYQQASDGTLSLGAVEWIVPAEPWDAESPDVLPSVMGHELHLNEALGVYVLHAWIFLDNPAGVFEDWNPDVTCPA